VPATENEATGIIVTVATGLLDPVIVLVSEEVTDAVYVGEAERVDDGDLVLATDPALEGMPEADPDREMDAVMLCDIEEDSEAETDAVTVAAAVFDAVLDPVRVAATPLDGLSEELPDADAVIDLVALTEGVEEAEDEGLEDMVAVDDTVLLGVTVGVNDVDGVGGMNTSGSDTEITADEFKIEEVKSSMTVGIVPLCGESLRPLRPSTAESTLPIPIELPTASGKVLFAESGKTGIVIVVVISTPLVSSLRATERASRWIKNISGIRL
jgi:hypothetical protein